jgi:hypothetical protein
VRQPVVDIKVGGRVRHFSSFWPSLTADDWILNAISVGVRIPFTGIPFQDRPGRNMSFCPELAAICQAEVDSLLEKGAVERIPLEERCFVSGIFVIPKSSGCFRPIVNLKGLNQFVEKLHFKMEGVSVMKGMVRKGDYFTKIDLQDAYLTIPIHSEDRKFSNLCGKGHFSNFRAFVSVYHPPPGPSQRSLNP